MSKTILEGMIEKLGCLEKEVQLQKDAIKKARREGKFLCKVCGQYHQIKKCSLIEAFRYDPNTGSPNGGYYKHDSYYIQCPTIANSYNRVSFRNISKRYENDLRREGILHNLFSVFYKKSFLGEEAIRWSPISRYYENDHSGDNESTLIKPPTFFYHVDNYWFDDRAEKLYGKNLLKSLGI